MYMDYSSHAPSDPLLDQTDGWGLAKTTPYSLGLSPVLGAHGKVLYITIVVMTSVQVEVVATGRE